MNKSVQILAFAALLSVLISSVAYAFNYGQQTDSATQTIKNVPYYYVDNNTSDVDSSADKGTHSNFTAQQQNPDSTYDILTENALVDNEYSIDLTGGYLTVSTADLSISQGTISFWIQFDSTTSGRPVGQNTDLEIRLSANAIVLDWGGDNIMTSANTFTTDTWYFMAFTWDEIANDLLFYVGDENSAPIQDANSQEGSYIGIVSPIGQATVYWGNGYGANQPVDGHMDDIRFYNTVKTLSEIAADYNQTLIGNESGLVNYYELNNDYTDSASTDDASLFGSGAFSTDIPSWNAGGFELDLEVQWTNIADYSESNEELCIYLSDYSEGSLDATGGYMIVGDGSANWGSSAGTISFWVKMDMSVQGRLWGQNGDMETRWSGSNLVLDWGGANSLTSATSFSADVWYFVAIVWDESTDDLFLYVGDDTNPPTSDVNSLNGTWTSTTPSVTENRFLNGLGGDEPVDGHGDDLRYYNIARNLSQIQSDYNLTLSGSEPNLRSYFRLNNNFDDIGPDNNDGSAYGSYSFSTDIPFNNPSTESIGVDVWTGSEWQNVIANLGNGWNNVTITSYLTSSTLTIRFKGNSETSDSTQDSWNIDTTVIHTYGGHQPPEVTRVQNAEGAFDLDGTSPQVSFAAAPTEGNLLVVIAGHRTGDPNVNPTATIAEPGWTMEFEEHYRTSTSDRRIVAIFWKVAGSSESSTVTIDWGAEPSGQGFAILQEFTGAANYSFVGADGSGSAGSSVATLDVPSSVLSAGGNDNILAIAGMVWRDDSDAIVGVGYSNLSDAVEVTAYSGLKGGSAFDSTNTSGTDWQTTVSWTNARMASGLLALFTFS
jgi:hypothetical protein